MTNAANSGFALMRAFRAQASANPYTTARNWLDGGASDSLAMSVSYHFECDRYWPWDDTDNCGVRVKARVHGPDGARVQLDSEGGAPLLHLPDGLEPLTGATIMSMSAEELARRGVSVKYIS